MKNYANSVGILHRMKWMKNIFLYLNVTLLLVLLCVYLQRRDLAINYSTVIAFVAFTLKNGKEFYYLSCWKWTSWIWGFLSKILSRGGRPSPFAVWINGNFIFVTQNSVYAGFSLIIHGFSFQILYRFEDILVKTVIPCYPRFWYSLDFLRT